MSNDRTEDKMTISEALQLKQEGMYDIKNLADADQRQLKVDQTELREERKYARTAMAKKLVDVCNILGADSPQNAATHLASLAKSVSNDPELRKEFDRLHNSGNRRK